MNYQSISWHNELHVSITVDIFIMWATSWENLVYAICEQQRHRSACTSAQSDQRLCCSLLRLYYTYTYYIQNFKSLASPCSWAGRFESYLVANPRRQVFSWRGSCYDAQRFTNLVLLVSENFVVISSYILLPGPICFGYYGSPDKQNQLQYHAWLLKRLS